MKSSQVCNKEPGYDPGRPGYVAILVAVLVTFFTAAVAQDPTLTIPIWGILLALGAVHLFLYFPGQQYFLDEDIPWRTVSYFGLQLAIVSVMHFLGNGHFWLLFLPLASVASFVFSRRMTILFSGVLLIMFTIPIANENLAGKLQYGLIFLSALVFVLIFSQMAIRELKTGHEKDRIARELEEANRRLKEYSAQAEELVRSRERNRMAREIHDSLGHYLTVVNVQLEAAKALIESRGWKDQAPDLLATLEKAQTLTRNGLEDVRRSVAALRAGATADRPLRDALNTLVEESKEAGLLADLTVAGSPRDLPPQYELTLFRAAQEGLTNVRKHARASHAGLRLDYLPQSVRLEVADNGIGLAADAETGEGRFGLLGLRERVELLHGRVVVEDAPGGGTRLSLELPA